MFLWLHLWGLNSLDWRNGDIHRCRTSFKARCRKTCFRRDRPQSFVIFNSWTLLIFVLGFSFLCSFKVLVLHVCLSLSRCVWSLISGFPSNFCFWIVSFTSRCLWSRKQFCACVKIWGFQFLSLLQNSSCACSCFFNNLRHDCLF